MFEDERTTGDGAGLVDFGSTSPTPPNYSIGPLPQKLSFEELVRSLEDNIQTYNDHLGTHTHDLLVAHQAAIAEGEEK